MSDTYSIGAILNALYESISGAAGKERDWDRFNSLFFPGARLVRTWVAEDGSPQALAMEVRAYREDTSRYFRLHPFYEAEIARRVESFGNLAHVFSTYEGRHDPADAEAFKRGINSIQLFHDGSRWWVISVLWDDELPGNPIPPEFLP